MGGIKQLDEETFDQVSNKHSSHAVQDCGDEVWHDCVEHLQRGMGIILQGLPGGL
jgi:hypothetical protein